MSTTMESITDTSMKPKKERKEKKSKRVTPSALDGDNSAMETLEESTKPIAESMTEDAPSSTKKRKRDPLPEEIEVDVAAPEPPSKKALRRLKKGKPVEITATSLANRAIANDTSDLNESTPAKPTTDATTTDAPRPVHGIWIGNLPFGATKTSLRDFLIANASSTPISADSITRIHMPVPHNAASSRTREKPQNKGYAYVDFSSKDALDAALALSESTLGGRKVLIKDAKSYAGRPEKNAAVSTSTGTDTSTTGTSGTAHGRTKAALEGTLKSTKRVFVGNLGFDVTKEDLSAHFGKCGTIEDIHMATFEDSGKCKGFAWVRFEAVEAAESAVRGWVRIPEPGDDDDGDDEIVDGDNGDAAPEDEAGEPAPAPAAPAKSDVASSDSDSNSDSDSTSLAPTTRPKPKAKPTPRPRKQNTRKWFVNRLLGRPLRCEFAEDASVRYKKRFGNKDRDADARPHNTYQHRDVAGDAVGEGEGEAAESGEAAYKARGANAAPRGKRAPREMQPGAGTDVSRRRGKAGDGEEVGERKEQKFKDSGDAGSRYRTGAIAEAKGKKVTFD